MAFKMQGWAKTNFLIQKNVFCTWLKSSSFWCSAATASCNCSLTCITSRVSLSTWVVSSATSVSRSDTVWSSSCASVVCRSRSIGKLILSGNASFPVRTMNNSCLMVENFLNVIFICLLNSMTLNHLHLKLNSHSNEQKIFIFSSWFHTLLAFNLLSQRLYKLEY